MFSVFYWATQRNWYSWWAQERSIILCFSINILSFGKKKKSLMRKLDIKTMSMNSPMSEWSKFYLRTSIWGFCSTYLESCSRTMMAKWVCCGLTLASRLLLNPFSCAMGRKRSKAKRHINRVSDGLIGKGKAVHTSKVKRGIH